MILTLLHILLFSKACICFQSNDNNYGDAECMELYCHKEWEECREDPTCLELLSCSSYCVDTWNDDPTQQKVHAQNCTMKCSATYEDNITDTYMACMFNNNCIEMPPINVTCPVKQLTESVEFNASLADLTGQWWQQYGYNALWDCYPCQHIQSMYIYNNTEWSYKWGYEVYLINGSLQSYQETWYLPYTPSKYGVPINLTYYYYGTPHNETWYILQATERYVVLIDCSYISTWTNVGSPLWVRPNVTLTNDEMNDISDVYEKVMGWKFPQEFCKTQHGDTCPGEENGIRGK